MSSTKNRLRRLHGLGKKSSKSKAAQSPVEPALNRNTPRPTTPTQTPAKPPRFKTQAISNTKNPLEKAVPGVELHNDGGTCYATAHAYPLNGNRATHLAALLNHTASHLAPFHPNFNLTPSSNFRTAAFLDTETTGLGSGAGVYCFMIGIGRFETYSRANELSQETLWQHHDDTPTISDALPTHFVVRQLFMRRPSEECALLIALADLLDGCTMTVSFNGRVFDLPLLRIRYQQNQQLLPVRYRTVPALDENNAHFDLLIPARRLWRRRLESCRLVWLEKHILGRERTSDDVPGHMIPLLYSQYVSSPTQEAGYMPGIFYHNREDITSMVILTAHLYDLFNIFYPQEHSTASSAVCGDTSSTVMPHGLDILSLGCCFESIDDIGRAEAAFTRALDLLGAGEQALNGRIEGYKRLGYLYKRKAAWGDATAIWQQWLTTTDDNDPTPYIELAKYCEWQTNDLEQAEMWTRWALHNLESSTQIVGKSVGQIEELNYRLSRIRRKRED